MIKKDLVVFVASGFEDIELITVLDYFSRNEVSFDLVSIEDKNLVKGAYNAFVETKGLNDFNPEHYNGLFLPGGPGHKILLDSQLVQKTVIDFNQNKKLITAICAAPEVLLQAGILQGKKITSYKGFAQNGNNTGNEIEVDNNIITGRDKEAATTFAFEVIKTIKK